MPLQSGLPEAVGDEEPLARFLTSSNHFSANGVKAAALMPNPRNGQTSVFRHPAEPQADLRALGKCAVSNPNLHGAAILTARNVRGEGLQILASEPPLRHANLEGWPWVSEDREFGKSKQKEVALALARCARLIRFV